MQRKLLQRLDANQRPYHEHDCPACVWFGSFVSLNMDRRQELGAVVHDVYVHYDERGRRENDVFILRTSSEGPDYESFGRGTAKMIHDIEVQSSDVKTELSLACEMIAAKKTHRWVTAEHELYSSLKVAIIDQSDNHGGRFVRLAIIDIGRTMDPDLIRKDKARIAGDFPSTYCRHSHDCCGHYYASSPKVRRLPSGKYLVRQQWSQNV